MNTKESLTEIGKILVQEHGKNKFYTSEQVKNAHDKIKLDVLDTLSVSADILNFAMSLYSPVEGFVKYFTSNTSNYLKLKTEALKEISGSDWDLIPKLDIEMSWLDAGDIFEGVLEGLGSFFSAAFEGLS